MLHPHRSRIVATLSLSAGLALPLAAADDDGPMKIRDLRVHLGAVPPSATHEQTAGQGLVGGTLDLDDDEFKAGPRVEIGFFESLGTLARGGGLVLGLSISFQEQDTGDLDRIFPINDGSGGAGIAQGPVELSVVVVDLHVGWAYALSRRTHLELLPYIGYGSANIQDTINADSDAVFSGDGPYWEAGARLGLYYSHPIGLQIGATVGLMYATFDTSADFAIVDNGAATGNIGEINYRGTIIGPTANVSIGLRF